MQIRPGMSIGRHLAVRPTAQRGWSLKSPDYWKRPVSFSV